MIRTRSRTRGGGSAWYKSTAYLLNNAAPTLIHDYMNDRYYTSSTGPIGFPFTATRTTNATMFDAQGRIVWAPSNILLRSDDPTASWTNTDTTPSTDGTLTPSGLTAYLMTEGSAGTALSSQQPVGAANAPFAFTIECKKGNAQFLRIRIGNGSDTCSAWIDFDAGTITSATLAGTATAPAQPIITDLGGGWYRCTIFIQNTTVNPSCLTNTSPSSGSTSRVNGGTYYLGRRACELYGIDSPKLPLQLTTGSAYYGPRFDYDPVTLQPLGILSELSRTNDLVGSFSCSSTNATLSSGTVKDGIWNFQRATATGVSAPHFVTSISAITPSATQARHVSAVVKPVSGETRIQLSVSANYGATDVYANFNITASGAVLSSGAGASSAFIRHIGNNYYHIGFDYTTNGAPASGAACVLVFITGDYDTRIPTNTSTSVIDIGFMENCAGSGWASFTPTFTTAATRSYDTFSVATGAWVDTTKGTMYAEFTRAYVAPLSGTSRVFAQLFADANNRLLLTAGTSTNSQHRFDVLSGGVSQAQIQSSVGGAAFTTRKMAGLYNTNLFKASENNASPADDTSGSVPASINTLHIGGWGGNNQISGWIKEFRYYPDASASSAQLNALTKVGTAISVPSGLRISSIPFNLSRIGDTVVNDFNPLSMIATPTTTYYVDPIAGNNGNAGTSAGAAFADLSFALGQASVDQIIITGLTGDYIAIGAKAWNNTQPNRTISVLNRTGYRFISTQCAGVPTWTVNGTYGNVYQATVTAANAGSVSDLISSTFPTPPSSDMTLTQFDDFSDVISACPKGFKHLVKVASLAAVNATAGTWYHDGATTLYVRAHDDRNLVGDTKMLPMLLSTTNGRWKPTSNDKNIYVENIDFVGGPSAFLSDAVSSITGQVLVFNKCSFQGSSSATGNGLGIRSFSTVYAYRCTATGNWADGFNYHSNESDGTTPSTSPTVYEIECLSYDNGITGSSGTSDNGSTAHDFCNVVRVNSVHLASSDATIAEINSAQTWNLGVYSAQASTVGAGRNNFKAANDVIMLLDVCVAQSGSNDRWLSETSTTVLKHYLSGPVSNGSGGAGTVVAYTG